MEEQAAKKRSDTFINNDCPVSHEAFENEFIENR
jgi:hypothetical protein